MSGGNHHFSPYSSLFRFVYLSKKFSAPSLFQQETNPLNNIQRDLFPETEFSLPLIDKISPSLWRRYFLLKDAFDLNREGELHGFTHGDNDMVDDYGDNREMKRIDFFRERKIEILEMVSGAYFTFFITSDGVYGIGENDDGQLGIGNNITERKFVKIEQLKGLKIKKIQGGNFFSMVLTEDSEVYGFGQNHWNQLGKPNDVSYLTPTKLEMFGKDKIELETIYCGEHNTFFVTKESEPSDNLNQLYGCGYTEFGQLGPEFTGVCVETPVLIEFFSRERGRTVKNMTSSYGFSFVLTQSNDVYSFGMFLLINIV